MTRATNSDDPISMASVMQHWLVEGSESTRGYNASPGSSFPLEVTCVSIIASSSLARLCARRPTVVQPSQ